ncbi:Ig-like domain repeat protein [Methanobrevibacter sp.]|uniref:Ig-like domain repeat protein n=1 Tax=Methanobrevibacter sp. TaxID=66852 RepID=UPI00388F125F
MNWKKIIILTLMTLVLFSIISVASANEYSNDANVTEVENVNTLNLADDSEVLTASDTFTQLDKTIQESASGATIVLDRDYIYTEGDKKSGISINKDITIDGKGHTLDGAGTASIFTISGNRHVTLKDITFINAYGSKGSAVSWTSGDSVNIINSNFINNTATGNGGAIYISSSNSTITFNSIIADSVFVNNRAANGGAIYASGTFLDIISSKFNSDVATENGGSILLDSGACIDGCEFINSSSGRNGGGIYVNSKIIDFSFLPPEFRDKAGILNSRMISCRAANDGGAGYIYLSGGSVRNVTVIGCFAGRDGGAGYIDGDGGILADSTFINNTASRNGGAVMWRGINGTIEASNFINSTTNLGDGGAVYLCPIDPVDAFDGLTMINSSTFYKNQARMDGGAIYCAGLFTVIFNSQFSFDSAYMGGSIYMDIGAAIYHCNFYKESATYDGGAIYLHANVSDIHDHRDKLPLEYLGASNSTFINCSAGHDGGAGYIKGDYGFVHHVVFANNTAGNDGGAAYVAGSYGTLYNSSMISNHAGHDGGAITWEGDHGSVDNTTFILNTVGGGSGSLCIYGSNSTVSNSVFTLSSSTLSGGAIYVYGDNVRIKKSIFDKCSSGTKDGGAIAISGYHTHVEECNFTMNRVNIGNGHGGAIYLQGNRTHIYNCNFERCTAFEGGFIYVDGPNAFINNSFGDFSFAVEGGAFYVNGDYATISYSNMSYNNATTYAGAIYVAGDFATIDHVDFEKCLSYNNGAGAIYVEGFNTTISNSRFVENKVSGMQARGGSINVQGNYTKILNCLFDKCTAYDGGVVYVNGSYALIDGYACIHSLALNNGGAMYVAGDYVTISNFNISLTNATNYGGALYIEGDHANVFNSNFTRCIAYNYNGGALYIAGLNATVSNSYFLQNKVNNQTGRGGSIEVQGNFTTIYNSTFEMCNAYEGGIIYINGSNTLIDGFTSVHCIAYNNGGAIYVAGDNAVFADFKIAMTNATNDGGAIYVAGDNATIYNGIIDSSIVGEGNGGSMYVAGYNTTVDNCTFDKTQASKGNGGAIFVEGDLASVENSNFIHSFAYDGGIIYIVGHDVLVDNSNFTYSWATESGGAIYVEGHDAVISNSNFKFTNASSKNNPYAGFGGAIYVFGDNVNITSSTFSNTISEKGGNGGAIFIYGENVTISKSNFTNTTAPDYIEHGGGASAAGAISIAGNYATIEDSNFRLCHARNAGAMFVAGTNTRIINSNLTDCFSDGDGGAIYIFGEYTNISGTVFDDCHGSDEGGAIFILFGEYANIENSTFIKCYSNTGGAMNIDGSDVKVSSSNMIDCYAVSDGGAVYISGNNITMNDTNFTDCYTINNNGGAIYWIGTLGLVNNSNFVNNTSPKLGGAIFMKENAKITFQNSHFTNNSAGINGGAIDFNRGAHDEIIINSTFENNYANRSAGAVFWFGTNGTIKDSTFINNRAYGIVNYTDSYGNVTYGGYGGAVMWTGAQGVVDNCTFINNYAQYNEATKSGGRGGAVYLQGSDVGNGHDTAFYNSMFINNTAGYNGGAVDWFRGAANGRVENSTFINNTAHRSGGGIYWSGVNGTIKNATFINNTALGEITDANGGGDGGAVLWVGPEGMIQTVNFTNNKAAYSGGAIFLKGSDSGTAGNCSNVFIEDGWFENNFAGLNGGAVTFQRGAMNGTLSNSTFINNTAARSGGAVFWYGRNGTIDNSTFIENEALGLVDVDARGVHQYIDENGEPVLGGSGGAVAWVGEVGHVNYSDFINNTAARLGGAIFLRDNENTTFNGDNFISNTAGVNGGAIDFNRGAANGVILNSTFENNVANRSGGAVLWFGTNGTIKGSFFKNNTALGIVEAKDSYGNLTYGGYGGAVMWTGAYGIVDNCTFIENEAKYNNITKSGGRGGAVYLQGSDKGLCMNTTFSNSLFINNTAGFNGGAIAWFKGARNGHVDNSTFINNTAQRSGGAISWSGINGTVYNATFVNNTALGTFTDANGGGDGGAILWVGRFGHIEDSRFTNNTAKYSGGAIFLKGSDDGTAGNCTNVSISNGWFENNLAGLNGGAVTFQRGAMNGTISGSTFINNTAERSGGAVFWFGRNGTITNSTFIENEALGLVDVDARGVHEYIDENGNPVLGGTGGAVAWVGEVGNINDTEFIKNTAARLGGAIFLRDNGFTTIAHDKFINNTANVNGGAIDFNRGAHDGVILNSTFENNVANRSGGAVLWFGTDGIIKDSFFKNNTALGIVEAKDSYGNLTYGGYGGAVMWTGAHGIVENCTFEENTAAKRGGAVYLQGSDVGNCTNTTFDGCTFTGNVAGTNGGAVDWHEGAHDGNIYNSTFTNNLANSNGGAVYWRGHNGKILNSNFTNNTAYGDHPGSYGNVGDGGAMFWAGINGLVENCRFIDNEAVNNTKYNASGRGGAVYIEPCEHGNRNTTFRNVYFENNTAGTNGGAINWHEGAVDGLVNNATFINNTAKRSGGAIFWNGYMGEIIYSLFYGNRALGITNATSVRGNITSGGDGGAIMWSGADGIVSHCNFVNNTAAKRGGAVLLQGNEEYPCLNTVFTDDYFANNVAGTNGGAIDWYRGARDGLVDNSTFINNTAYRAAGAIYWSGVNGTVRNSKFIENTALGNITDANGGGDGGAILWVGQNGHIEDSNFSDNYAAFSGGAIFLKGNDDTFSGHCDNVTVTNTIFANNVAGLNGGAVTFQRGARNGQLSDSKFINNTAFRNGGAVFWYGTNGTLSNCSFLENNALGLVDEDSRGLYEYYDSQGNQVLGGSGGAVAWTGDIGAIKDSRFENNTAARYGGAIFLRDNVNTTYDGSSFINNKANHGGAIYWVSDTSVNLTNCILIGNIASKGSAVYLSHNMMEIINSTFLDNRADAAELTLNVTRSDDNHTIHIIATFKGNDNLLNAIWNDGQIALTNVTYLGVNGVANTGGERRIPVILASDEKPSDYNNIYQTQYEDCQNITFYIYDNKNNLLTSASVKTNISGMAKFKYTSSTDELYEYVFHPMDNYYTGIDNSTGKKLVNVIIPAADICYLENESFIISVVDRQNSTIPTGNVTVLLNGVEIGNFTLNDGKTTQIKLNKLPCGTYDVKVEYHGDDTFLPMENSTTFKVMKIPSYIIPTVENYTYGESGKIIIQIPQGENNTISIRLNGKTYEVKINESGRGEFEIPELDFGVYKVELIYPETNNYLKSTNSTEFEIYPIINVNVVKSANVTDAYVLDEINFTFTVSNDGQITANNVTVSDKFSDDFVIMTYAEGGKVLAGNVIRWNIDELESGSKMNLWVLVSPIMNCTFTNVATVKSDEAGVNKSNEVNVSVKPVVDLYITKKVNATEVFVDDKITYTIEVVNFGLCNATNVKVSEKLSKSLKLISADTKYGHYDRHGGIWYIGNLNALDTASLTLTVRTLSGGTIENNVSVTSDEKDLIPDNNNYTCENVIVSKWDVPIVIEAKNLTYGEAAIIDIHTPEGSNGTFNITICGETYNDIPCDEGAWEYVKVHIAAGNYSVNVTYSGDNKYMPSSAYLTFYVAKLTPTIKVEVVDILEGEIEVLNVTVNAPGTVNITVGGVTIEIPLNESVATTDLLGIGFPPKYDGKATWRLINLAKGTYDVYAVYNGNENYTTANASDIFHVRGEIDDVEVDIGDVSVGETARIEVKYPEDATGNVTITVDGKTYTKPLENGSAVFEVPNLKAGQHKVDVSYSGDDKYLPNEVNKTFEVSKLNPRINVNIPDVAPDNKAKITVTLPEDAAGTVSVKINGKTYTASVKNGKATVTIPNIKAGHYDVDVSYSGDDKYNGTGAKKSFDVSKSRPKISIEIDEVKEGETAKITVTLPKDATGTVTLEIGGKYYSAQVKDGKAVFYIPNLKAGDYNIAVHYLGDDQYLEEYAYDIVSVDFNENGNSDDTNDVKHESHEGLAKYPTANPIFVLMLAILAMGSTQLRRFKKE